MSGRIEDAARALLNNVEGICWQPGEYPAFVDPVFRLVRASHVESLRRALGFDYVWYWRKRHGDRKGQRCAVWARGTMNSIGVVFEDGFITITSRWAVRKASR